MSSLVGTNEMMPVQDLAGSEDTSNSKAASTHAIEGPNRATRAVSGWIMKVDTPLQCCLQADIIRSLP